MSPKLYPSRKCFLIFANIVLVGVLAATKETPDNLDQLLTTDVPEQQVTLGPVKERATLKAADLTDVTTRKPSEKKKAQTTTTTVAPVVTTKTLYRLDGDEGGACILLRTDALVTFMYTSRLKEEIVKDIYVPENAETAGECLEDTARLELKWPDFNLRWFFEKTPGGERWFVDKIELWFDASSRKLQHMRKPDEKYTLSTPKSVHAVLFVTPVGQAYSCFREVSVNLTSATPPTDVTATVLLREFEVQPFIFKNSQFGPEYRCPAPGESAYRSEAAPLIVGSLLAAACLGTVTGYSVFRYFKIKKVQYDTME